MRHHRRRRAAELAGEAAVRPTRGGHAEPEEIVKLGARFAGFSTKVSRFGLMSNTLELGPGPGFVPHPPPQKKPGPLYAGPLG